MPHPIAPAVMASAEFLANLAPTSDFRLEPIAGLKRDRPSSPPPLGPADFTFAAPPKTLSLPPVSLHILSKINSDLDKTDPLLGLPPAPPASAASTRTSGGAQASTSALTLDHAEEAEEAGGGAGQGGPRKKARKAVGGSDGADGGEGRKGAGSAEVRPPRAGRHRSRAAGAGHKSAASSGTESLWPPELDQQLINGLEHVPNTGRNTVVINGTTAGRNEILSEWLRRKTGQHRTRLQISSRLQKLRTANKHNRDKLKILTQPALSDAEFAALDFHIILGEDEAAISKGEAPAKLEISKAPPPTSNLKRGHGGKKQSPKAEEEGSSILGLSIPPSADLLLDPLLQLSSVSSNDSMYLPVGSTPASLADLFPNPAALEPPAQSLLPLSGFSPLQLAQPSIQSFPSASAPFAAFPSDLSLAPAFPMPISGNILGPSPSLDLPLSTTAAELVPFPAIPAQTGLSTTLDSIAPVVSLGPDPYQLPSFAPHPLPLDAGLLSNGLLTQAQLEQLTQAAPPQQPQPFGMSELNSSQIQSLLGPPLTGA